MLNGLITRYPNLISIAPDIERARDMIIECYERGGKLLLAGNGGSAADCEHIVGELMKGFLSLRPLSEEKKADMKAKCPELDEFVLDKLQAALPAISLPSITALNTAFMNDVMPELVFAQPLMSLARENDIFIALSTSGNSKNVVMAAKVAKALGIKVIALTGESGGKLFEIADLTLRAPECETYKIQELHLPIYHYLCAAVEKHFFG